MRPQYRIGNFLSSLDLKEECGGDTVRRAGCIVGSAVMALEAMSAGFFFPFCRCCLSPNCVVTSCTHALSVHDLVHGSGEG